MLLILEAIAVLAFVLPAAAVILLTLLSMIKDLLENLRD